MGEPKTSRATRTVLLINGPLADEQVLLGAVNRAGASCLQLAQSAALAFLRTDPFAVAAVILIGDGASVPTGHLLSAVKRAAPRLPVVFVDSSPSMDSELCIRRAGVHFYSHTPVNGEELEAVLGLLTGAVVGPGKSRISDCSPTPVPKQTRMAGEGGA